MASPERPLVSIALATYNGARHLDEQLASLRAQTYAPLEIVAADDGSTDGTLAILERHAAADPRIRLLPAPAVDAARGLNANFRRCFAHCRGQFIAPSDQDDIWHPEKIERLVHLLGSPDAGIAYADSTFIDEQGRPLDQSFNSHFRLDDLSDPRQVALENCVSGHAMVFRRELLAQAEPFPATDYYDWWLTFVALSAGWRVRYLDQAMVRYRRHAQALTHAPKHRRNTPAKRAAVRRGLAERRSSLRVMAAFPSPFQGCFIEMEQAWLAWRDGFTGLAMTRFVWRHAGLLHGMVARPRPAWAWARRYLAGYRTRRLTNPGRYPPAPGEAAIDRAP